MSSKTFSSRSRESSRPTSKALLSAAVIVWLVGVCRPTSYAADGSLPDAIAVAGICARCHERQAELAVETGGHATGVICEDCHQNRRAGRFGRHHRTLTSCASHHNEVGHPARARRGPSAQRKRNIIRNCTRCHEPHGTENKSLVRDVIHAGRRRLTPVFFDNESGAAPGGFTNPVDRGTGLCEVCHRKTFFYRRDGSGSHETDSCVSCHKHGDGFEPRIQ